MSKTSKSTSQTLVGIAFYHQPNLRLPRWALVLHRKRYDSKHVRVYQISKNIANDEWVLDHKKCHLEDLGDLIGVLHLTVSPHDINRLDQLLRAYPAGKESKNPGQVFAWSPSGWVIRALIEMHEEGFAIIPGKFRSRHLWEVGVELSYVLREKSATQRMPIIFWPTA